MHADFGYRAVPSSVTTPASPWKCKASAFYNRITVLDKAIPTHPQLQLYPCLLCPTGPKESKLSALRTEVFPETHLETSSWICKRVKKVAVSTFNGITGLARFIICDYQFTNKQWKFVIKKILQNRRLKTPHCLILLLLLECTILQRFLY